MTAPVLTPVIGVPSTIPPSKLSTLTGIASYDGPYIGGATGLGLGQTPFKYDTDSSGYVTLDTPAVPLALPLARGDIVGSSGAKGWLLIDLTWQGLDGSRQTKRLTLRPQAGSTQTLDLTVDQAPLAYTTPQSLLDLIARATTAAARAEVARGDLSGTRAQRLAYNTSSFTKPTYWEETDTHVSVTYYPGAGWKDKFGGDPDAMPAPDTGRL